jgi:hypothetical protein
MNDCAGGGTGGHSSRRILPVALLLYLSGAWAQEAADPEPAQTPATVPAESQEKRPADPSPPLDLYLGSAKELLPQGQWDTIIASQPDDSAEQGDLPALGHDEDVQVEGTKQAPKVPSGIAGLFWALRHPTQAWRVFAPAR